MSTRKQQLLTACIRGDLDTVKSLLTSSDCDPEIRDEQGNTLLHIACQKGSDVNCQAKDVSTPLHYACYFTYQGESLDIAKYLITEQQCDVNVQNKDGDSPLHIACYFKAFDIIEFLLQQRCDTTVRNKKGQSPQTLSLNEDGDLLLHIACQWRDVDIVRYLLCEQHCEVNVRNANGDTPLHIACYQKSLEIIKFLLRQRCDTRIRNKRGQSPQTILFNEDSDLLLHIACRWGDVDIVRYLVCEQQCDVNAQNEDGDSPLLIACCNNFKVLDIIKTLLQQRSDTTVQNKSGQIPQTIPFNENDDLLLHIACQWRDVAIVRYLVCEQQCAVNIRNKNGDSPLHIACYYKAFDIIKFLLQKRCHTSSRNDSQGESPQTISLNEDGDLLLHMACQWGDLKTVKYLVCEQRCDVNAQNKNGDSPLHITCYYKAFDIIKFLLQQRCDTKVRNKRGQSPQTLSLNEDGDLLLHIAFHWWDVDIVRYLLCKQHCDVNVRNSNGDTPLHIACYQKSLEIIKFLLRQRCDTRVRNKRGQSPQTILFNEGGDLLLHIACRWGDVDIVRYLVCEQQCDVNAQNEDGDSPLLIACCNKVLDIIKTLLQQRSDTTVQNKSGQIAQTIPFNENDDLLLHIACQWRDVAIVRYLVCEQQCAVNIRNKNGDSPLHIACYYKAFDIIKFLLQKRCHTSSRNNSQGESPQTISLNEDGDLLLHMACQWGDVDIVSYIVRDQNCNANAQNKNGESPLHTACYYKVFNIIKFLLQQRCDTKVRNKRGQSPQTIPLNENGDLLLHIACRWEDVAIVRYLVCEQHCEVNVQNNSGDSPLLIVCCNKVLGIVRFLLQQRCDTRVRNKRGQSPQTIPLNENGDLLLHIACRWGDVDIVRYLVCEQQCDVNAQNKNGDSPLHTACYNKALDIIKFLLQQRYNTSIRNKRGQSPQTIPLNENGELLLHIACRWGDVDIVRYLVCEQQCDVNAQNKNGDSPLHIACYNKALDIIKFLLQQRYNTSVQNKRGQSPQTIPLNEDGDVLLHFACLWGDVDIVRYLVCEQQCDVNAQNKNGDSPLHIACYNKALNIIKFLLQQRYNISIRNKRGQSPQTIPLNEDGDVLLHFACLWGDVDIVRYLVCKQHCDVNAQNNKGSLPLHIAIVSGQPSTALCLLEHEQCNPILPDSDGNTPLHLACMKCTNIDGDTEMLQVARFLLSSTDLSACVNNAGQTPVELTTNYQLIQDISHITECETKHSIQTYIKMFFIGNPSTGKSTLVKAIYSETSWWWKFLPRWFSRVRHVPVHTAGIIPIKFRSKTFGNTVLYDMAGQYEYYTSHAAVIESSVLSSPPAFVVVVDLSESDDRIMEKLKYWWSFIDNHAARPVVPPHVVLIGSHADVVKARGGSVQHKMSTISLALRALSSSFHFVGYVALDCRDPVSSELDQFCSLVDQSCTALRQTIDIDLRCHVAYSFLLERFEGRVACTLSEVAAQITATDTLLPQSPDELARLMSSLSDKGLVLLIKSTGSIEESWVILQKEKLLNEFDGTIFAPENFREHIKDFARSTGVVPFSRIKQEFPQYDPAMIVGFLTHLEFCFKIDDPETIKRIEDEAPKDETCLDPSDEFYFFPALVNVDTPHQVWQQDDLILMQHQCGWYYKCHPDQFLTSRFLHVLILRLAFSFALGLDQYHPSQSAPVLCRRCSVWKHGIGWLQDGIETVVEVGLQCQWVTVMMRCLKGKEVKCVQRHLAVIQEIKKARYEFSKAVKMTALVIHPSNVHYPFSHEHISLYSLTHVANAIAKIETHVEDQHGHNSILICDLVLFESYLSVGAELLNELFHPDNSDKRVSRSFLDHLAGRVHHQMSLFEEVIDPQPVIDYQKELEKQSLPGSKCLVLLQWLLRKLKNPTYENFHKELDKYSIFSGTNPMVSESSRKHSLCKTVPV